MSIANIAVLFLLWTPSFATNTTNGEFCPPAVRGYAAVISCAATVTDFLPPFVWYVSTVNAFFPVTVATCNGRICESFDQQHYLVHITSTEEIITSHLTIMNGSEVDTKSFICRYMDKDKTVRQQICNVHLFDPIELAVPQVDIPELQAKVGENVTVTFNVTGYPPPVSCVLQTEANVTLSFDIYSCRFVRLNVTAKNPLTQVELTVTVVDLTMFHGYNLQIKNRMWRTIFYKLRINELATPKGLDNHTVVVIVISVCFGIFILVACVIFARWLKALKGNRSQRIELRQPQLLRHPHHLRRTHRETIELDDLDDDDDERLNLFSPRRTRRQNLSSQRADLEEETAFIEDVQSIITQSDGSSGEVIYEFIRSQNASTETIQGSDSPPPPPLPSSRSSQLVVAEHVVEIHPPNTSLPLPYDLQEVDGQAPEYLTLIPDEPQGASYDGGAGGAARTEVPIYSSPDEGRATTADQGATQDDGEYVTLKNDAVVIQDVADRPVASQNVARPVISAILNLSGITAIVNQPEASPGFMNRPEVNQPAENEAAANDNLPH